MCTLVETFPMANDPNFSNAETAIEYYKNLAETYKKRLEDSQQELEEFQTGSRELEAELETQLEQSDSKIKELKSANTKLQSENDRLQAKLNECQGETSQTIASLQDELLQLKLVRDDLRVYIRKLEQKNDDLERAMRASVSSLEDFEARLNQAIERNAYLENELDEKENMAALIQRLKDETRDLKQELNVHDFSKTTNNSNNSSPPNSPEKIIDSNKSSQDNSPRHRLKRSFTHPNGTVNSLTPNVPYSALNIVGDLLKKVVLESKLQSCRDCIKENPDQIVEKCKPTKLTSPKIMFQSREAHEWIVTIHSKGLHPINSLNNSVFVNQK